jgi:hypothetical protein
MYAIMGIFCHEVEPARLNVAGLPGDRHPRCTAEARVSGSCSSLGSVAHQGAQPSVAQERHRWTLHLSTTSLQSCSSQSPPSSPTRARFSDSPRSVGTGTMSSPVLPPFGCPSIAEGDLALRFFSRDPGSNPIDVTIDRRFSPQAVSLVAHHTHRMRSIGVNFSSS